MKMVRLNLDDPKFLDVLKVIVTSAVDKFSVRDQILHVLERDYSLSPADYEAAKLAGWAVVEELKQKIVKDKEAAERLAKDIEPTSSAYGQFDTIRATYMCVEEMLANLESAHSAEMDKYREMVVAARAWEIAREAGTLCESCERALGDICNEARAELAGQEGEEKDERTA